MQNKGKILIIDDDLIIQAVVLSKLPEHGYTVQVAKDGIEGLEIYKSFHPDIIVLDIMMPRMNGYQFVEEFERMGNLKLTPIIMLSAQESMQDIFRMQGINDYIVKPFRMEDLLRKIAKRMENKHKKILIVDNQSGVLEMMEDRLHLNGYEVITATQGLEGLEKTRGEKPDLVVVDVAVPKLDGYTFCRMIKFDEKYRWIAIVLLSAVAHEQDEQMRKEVRADAHLTKPYDASLLLDVIKKLLWD